jgi:hypothetical protein
MDSPINKHRVSFLADSSLSLLDEDRIIEEAITTPYEKVLKILTNIKKFIIDLNSSKHHTLIEDLDWVIKRIQSHTLYTYDLNKDNEELEKYSQESPEIKSFLEFLSDYSEAKDMRKRNKKNQEISKTVKLKERPLLKTNEVLNSTHLSINAGNVNKDSKKNLKLGTMMPMKPGDNIFKKINTEIEPTVTLAKEFKIEMLNNNQTEEKEEEERKCGINSIRKLVEEREGNNSLCYSSSSKCPSGIISSNSNSAQLDLKIILQKDFNIHDFEICVGRRKVFPLITKTLYKTLDLYSMINVNKLDTFAENIANSYIDTVHYHNSIHAADVAQTTTIFLINSNLEEISQITNLDVLALITACLAHDIGHPGTNNSFQINSYSDMAIQHNDVSVLENYHASTFFMLHRKEENNIFDKIDLSEYRLFRKRIVNLILATDMVNHAKIVGVMKNKVSNYNQEKENDPNVQFIQLESSNSFEEQQKLLDLVIHTADLSHNSKSFLISYKWTELLMEEFWQQGDIERKMGLPISFLCDRTTADIPKGQIGFIKGIILPTFDVMFELFPSLNYLREVIMNNLDEWAKRLEEGKINTPRNKKPNTLKVNTNKKSGIFSKEIGFDNSPVERKNQQKLMDK